MKSFSIGILLFLTFRVGLAAGPDLPSITFTGYKWDAYGNYLPYFKVSNKTSEVFAFWGYSKSSPVYSIEVLINDRWQENPLGWCGNGMQLQTMAPEDSFVFFVPPRSGDASWRVRIDLEPRSKTRIYYKPNIHSSPLPTSDTLARMPPAGSSPQQVMLEAEYHDELQFPCRFRLTNISDSPVYYGGFDEKSVPPIYLGQKSQGNAWVNTGSANWRGTGFGFKMLSPGSSLSFDIPAQNLDTFWRIGIRLYRNNAPERLIEAYDPIWWPKLPRRGTAPEHKPEAVKVTLIPSLRPPPDDE